MTFQPLTNYQGYNHVPQAGAVWFHPNGNAYCCAVEKDPSKQQDLSVYRRRFGTSEWGLVKRYEGGQASAAQVTFGGAGIAPNGNMLVVTSLIIPGAPIITTEKFQGCWIEEPGIDDPYLLQSDILARIDGLHATIAALEARVLALPPTTTGPIVRIPASSATEGGQVNFEYEGGVCFIDVSNKRFRIVKQEAGKPGVVLASWG